jgi:hypothetical protein
MSGEPILISSSDKPFHVFANPSFSELSEIGSLVGFTADNKAQKVYVWNFNSGHHADVSGGLKLNDSFDSLDFLKGHAGRTDDGTYEMGGSDISV